MTYKSEQNLKLLYIYVGVDWANQVMMILNACVQVYSNQKFQNTSTIAKSGGRRSGR